MCGGRFETFGPFSCQHGSWMTTLINHAQIECQIFKLENLNVYSFQKITSIMKTRIFLDIIKASSNFFVKYFDASFLRPLFLKIA